MTMPSIDLVDISTVIAESAQSVQVIIDDAAAKNQALYDQRAALESEMATLRQQLAELNAQITAAEGPDVAKARLVKAALTRINSNLPPAAQVGP